MTRSMQGKVDSNGDSSSTEMQLMKTGTSWFLTSVLSLQDASTWMCNAVVPSNNNNNSNFISQCVATVTSPKDPNNKKLNEKTKNNNGPLISSFYRHTCFTLLYIVQLFKTFADVISSNQNTIKYLYITFFASPWLGILNNCLICKMWIEGGHFFCPQYYIPESMNVVDMR